MQRGNISSKELSVNSKVNEKSFVMFALTLQELDNSKATEKVIGHYKILQLTFCLIMWGFCGEMW